MDARTNTREGGTERTSAAGSASRGFQVGDRVAWTCEFDGPLFGTVDSVVIDGDFVRRGIPTYAMVLRDGRKHFVEGVRLQDLRHVDPVGDQVAAIAADPNAGGIELPSCPAEPSDDAKAANYYRAAFLQRAPRELTLYEYPDWVPSVVRLPNSVSADFPFIGRVASGIYDCEVNPLGAVAVRDGSGKLLGLRPGEFEPVMWKRNDKKPSRAG